MIRAVLDTSAVIAAVFWPRTPENRVLAALALRYWRHYTSLEVFGEYQRVTARRALDFPGANWQGRLEWLRLRSIWVTPAPLGKQRSRDATDDPVLACAVAAQAHRLIARDHDLLVLGKPFGITICTADAFLRDLKEAHRADWPF